VELIEEWGCELVYLPSYSSDLDPIAFLFGHELEGPKR
jgi:transposase